MAETAGNNFLSSLFGGSIGGGDATAATTGSGTLGNIIGGVNAFTNLNNSLNPSTKPVTAAATPITPTFNLLFPSQPAPVDDAKVIIDSHVDTGTPATPTKNNTLWTMAIITGAIIIIMVGFFVFKSLKK